MAQSPNRIAVRRAFVLGACEVLSQVMGWRARDERTVQIPDGRTGKVVSVPWIGNFYHRLTVNVNVESKTERTWEDRPAREWVDVWAWEAAKVD